MNAKKTTQKKATSKKAKEAAKAKQGRSPAPTKTTAKAQPKKLSAIAAAARVLAETGKPMTSQEMIDAMGAKRYWTSPGGKTPAATLYAAIIREIGLKGADARFKKTERGKFAGTNAG